MQYLSQQELETLPIGTRLWLVVHDSVHFSATLTGLQCCNGHSLGIVLIDLDEAEMAAIFKRDHRRRSVSGTIALTESSEAAMWAFTPCEEAEYPSDLLFNSREDLRLKIREGAAADIRVSIHRLRRQLNRAKRNIEKKEMAVVELA